ncbi:MAG: hypothetical protein AAF611_13465 [Bacteroidota bacterium]
MGLLGDIDEVKKVWKNSSRSFKGFIIIASFFTFSPIASLADILFQYKGFILDAILFYRTYITEPLRKLLNEFNLVFPKYVIDTVILTLIVSASSVRLILYRAKRANKHKNTFRKILFTGFVAIGIPLFFVSSILIPFHYNLHNVKEEYITPAFKTIIFLTLICFYTYMAWDLLKKASVREKLVFLVPIIFSIAAVLILGAINNFLSR